MKYIVNRYMFGIYSSQSLIRASILLGLIVTLVIWLMLLVRMNQDAMYLDIDYYDVVSELFSIAFVILLLGVNLRFESDSAESKLMFLGFCLMLVGHGHDLIDEFISIQPDWLSLIFENVCNNLGIVIIAVAVSKWSGRYQKQLQLLKKQKLILTAASNTDPLTRLYNRRFLNNEFIQNTAYFGEYRPTTSLLLIDLDEFKRVNDTYGHAIGDKLIMHLADVIRSEIRDDDYAFRYGGEEFLVVIQASANIAMKVAERIRTEYQTSEFNVDNVPLEKSASIGLYELETGVSFEQGLDVADKALYQAKESGRNSTIRGRFTQNPTPAGSAVLIEVDVVS